MLSNFKTGCTLFGAKGDYTVTGDVLIASTSDNEYFKGPRKPVILNSSLGRYRVIHTPCLLKSDDGRYIDEGSDRGLNSAGFCWTRSWAITNEDVVTSPGLSSKDWFLQFGSSSGSVEEAIEFMKNRPRPFGVNGNYIIGDAKGYLAVVELGFHHYEIAHFFTPQESGIITRVNGFETETMQEMDCTESNAPMYYETSAIRKLRLALLIKEYQKLSIDNIKVILSDQEGNEQLGESPHGAGICSIGLTHGTVSSEIFYPKEKIFFYSYGFPKAANISLSQLTYGCNKNSWNDWLPFHIDRMQEEGSYSCWDGTLTQAAIDYFESSDLQKILN